MNKIIGLKALTLENFKGVRNLNIEFGKTTNIYGENGVGKTTVFDSVTWLLFDKDSSDRKQFELKTLDSAGSVEHGLEHTVKGLFEVEGVSITLSKTYKEKWTKKKGEAQRTLTGHETVYSIDDVPVKKSEYVWQVEKFIEEKLFKLLTSPLYFSTNLKWEERRKMLVEIIGGLSDEEIMEERNLTFLKDILDGKDIETAKRSLAARRKKLNESIKAIPVRIDETNKSIQEVEDLDSVNSKIDAIKCEIEKLNGYIADESRVNDDKLKIQEKVFDLKTKIKEIEYASKRESSKPLDDMKIKLVETRGSKQNAESNIKQLEIRRNRVVKRIDDLNIEITELREKWHLVDKETINISDDNFICPTCQRELETDDIEQKKNELQENFNKDKSRRLASIRQEGQKKSADLKDLEKELNDIKENLDGFILQLKSLSEKEENLEELISNFKPVISGEFADEIKVYEKEIESLQIPGDSSLKEERILEYKNEKQKLEAELKDLNRMILISEQNEKARDRVKELMEEESELASQIAEIEGQEFECEQFVKLKIEMLESKINAKFKYVKFKLFNTQVNGALDECCETLIGGVPFADANTASKVNGGIDIINTLSEYFGVQAPVFIDNRESVNNLIECKSQVVNLIVSKDKNLKVEVL